MTSFDINESPTKLYLGAQPQVTLVNDGPYSVYLDRVPGVDSVNGFELPPTGQMTWKPDQELWAVTRTILTPIATPTKARLVTSPGGELSLTTRARFFKELYNATIRANSWATEIIEVGHCTNLLITRSTIAMIPNIALENIGIGWYDEKMNPLMGEFWSGNICKTSATGVCNPTSSDASLRAVIPVKGKYVSIAGVNTSGSAIEGQVLIIGTDEPLASRIDGGIHSTIAVAGIDYTANIAKFTGVTLNGVGDSLHIPVMGNRVKLFLENPGATAAFIYVQASRNSRSHDLIAVPANQNVTYDGYVPGNQTIDIMWGSGAFTAGNITAVYPNDQIPNG